MTPLDRVMIDMSKLTYAIGAAVLFSLVAIGVPHTDELPFTHGTPFHDNVMKETDCATNAEAGNDDCVQAIRQIQSLVAAMAAAICTIAAVAESNRRGQVVYGSIAGVTALKAVFHQFMYITDGNLMVAYPIIVVAAMPTVLVGAALLFGDRRSNEG